MSEDDEERRSEGFGFDPPVYKQRYNAVLELSRQLLPKTVRRLLCIKTKRYHELITGS